MNKIKRKVRTVRLENITYPVCVAHGKLQAHERIDSLDTRVDTLNICVDMGYKHQGPTRPGTMDNVWNYGAVYERLCMSEVPTIEGPLERILDAAMFEVCGSVSQQGLTASHVFVTADRMGLSVGYPQLSTGCVFQDTATRKGSMLGDTTGRVRSVGIKNQPLIVHVDHSWCQGNQRVEHVDARTEAVEVSFSAVTESEELTESDLTGLFNYAGLIHAMQGMQNMSLKGPVEEICDTLADMLDREAKKLNVHLLQTGVEVRRTSYARCTPVLGLQTWYGNGRG